MIIPSFVRECECDATPAYSVSSHEIQFNLFIRDFIVNFQFRFSRKKKLKGHTQKGAYPSQFSI